MFFPCVVAVVDLLFKVCLINKNSFLAWPSDKEIKFRNPPGDDLREGKRHFLSALMYPMA